jgi:hypothetical protein
VSGGSGFIGTTGGGPSVQIWEDAGKGVMKIADFDEEARKEAGKDYIGRWSGIGCQWERVVCDPTREQAYFLKGSRLKRLVFDLKTGDLLREVTFPNMVDDIAFDSRGYMHCHFVGTVGAVMRVDPARATRVEVPSYDTEYCPRFALGEVPYDYGVEKDINKYRALGVLPVKDQRGPKHFQDGLGCNMRGDVAVESQIYYVPKMEEQMAKMLNEARINPHGDGPSGHAYTYESSMRDFAERQKRGEKVYSIARRPGVPLHGATIWTYDSTGEVRAGSPAVIGRLVAGCAVDEDGALYFICNYPRAVGDKPFLRGRGGTFGITDDRKNRHPHTGTLVKARGKNVKILRAKAEVPLDPRPERAPDMFFLSSRMVGEENRVWMEGAEWFYGGASPIIDWGCSCPTSRFHLDWYKRTYVPEAYRHSFGVVDTNGNLIMHLGKYGNLDSGNGDKSKVPVSGDNIAVFIPRFIGGTDNYLCFSDWGERLAVLKIAYHAEETAPVK